MPRNFKQLPISNRTSCGFRPDCHLSGNLVRQVGMATTTTACRLYEQLQLSFQFVEVIDSIYMCGVQVSVKRTENGQQLWCVGMLLARFLHISSLRTLRPLDNLKLNNISFLQGAITVANNRRIMNEDVGTVIVPNKSVAFCVIEPFYRSVQAYSSRNKCFCFWLAARILAERELQSTKMC